MDKVYVYLLEELNKIKGETIIAGISGGPDSMVLLCLLIELKKITNIEIICAHVNHSLRLESDEEEVFLKKYCDNNNIKFEYMKIEKQKKLTEDKARVIRYDFFEKLIKKYKSTTLMTAHHGDDLIETVLMRITRGSTLKGYSGFSKKVNDNGYNVIKPLIFTTKEEIMNFAKDKKLEYRIDKTNESEDFTRNRYRKYILPFLKKEDANVHQKFLKYSETLIKYNNYIDKIMLKTFKKVFKDNTLNIDEFNKLDEIIKEKTINYIFEIIYDDNLMLINDMNSKQLLEMINNRKPNCKIYLPDKLQAIKKYNIIEFKKEIESEDYKLNLDEITYLPNGKKLTLINESDSDSNFICRLNKNDISLPLYIRNRKNGDKINLKGTNGTKKIKDIFIDEKISLEDRKKWPLLVDSKDNIIWIPGLKKSKINQPKNQNCDIIIKYD